MFFRQEPSPADVIIGLGSHDLTVADEVALLYERKIAPLIVFSGNVGRMTAGVLGKSEAQVMKERALQLGVPETVIMIEDESTNTGENIVYSQRLLDKAGIVVRSVVLVHKPYMLRRDYATFMKQWKRADQIVVTCWASSATMIDYLANDSKVTPFETIGIMVGDLQRVKEYPRYGYQIDQDIPPRVLQAYNRLVERGYTQHLIEV